ncbi:hypothetical protein SETIT_3G313300v2 [Setaria italica]|uniref:Uncharacterized protein n=1 Tax=Setaria italica TaxID=4555 RepID=A0A368QKT3_SETIT|nr:hypothetical protein SETIT_3G313300v2 [Setaria italica]
MVAVRSGSMSRAAHIRTREVLAKLDKDNKEIPPDIRPSSINGHQEAPGEALSRIHLGLILQELSDCSKSDDGYGDNTNDEQLAKRVTQVDLYHVTYHANNDRLISRVPPPRANTKGRSIPASKKKEISLGVKGVKKGTRRCNICGYYATHNARTCPKLQHNKERLEVLKNRMRGRPRGAQHKSSASQHDSGGEEHNIG